MQDKRRIYTLYHREIVCLCGSTHFKSEYQVVSLLESLKGKLILSVGAFDHADNLDFTIEQKQTLDDLHLDKIRLSDTVIIINPDGYIGDSTKREITFAKSLNIPVYYYTDLIKIYPIQNSGRWKQAQKLLERNR